MNSIKKIRFALTINIIVPPYYTFIKINYSGPLKYNIIVCPLPLKYATEYIKPYKMQNINIPIFKRSEKKNFLKVHSKT